MQEKMLQIYCPFCKKRFEEIPNDGICPQCHMSLAVPKGKASLLQKLPWLFWFATLLPGFLEWLIYFFWFLNIADVFFCGFAAISMSSTWGWFIMPECSECYKKEGAKHSRLVGSIICAITFVLEEAMLLILAHFCTPDISLWSIIVSHTVSVYYLFCGIVIVFFGDIVRFDLVHDIIEDRFIIGRGTKIRSIYGLYFTAIGAVFGIVVYLFASLFGF